ncbi:MAG: hypothetical protein QOK47_1105 [Actinomycetota bacterium]|jgi:hypothetical protein|nr:hypothetical protein [Actinomycetota bacterium]
MGARLAYAKVIDRQLFYERGGNLHPKLENEVVVPDEPGVAGAFLVFRGWADDHGSFTEGFRIKEPEGRTVYTSSPREVHIPSNDHTERLEDEVADLELEFASEGYLLIFYVDDREVASVSFDVKLENS